MRLRPGSSHPIVDEVQKRLVETDFGEHLEDPSGTLDEGTAEALTAFQEEEGLEVTGQIDKATLDALQIEEELPRIEPERKQFRKHLLQNPNYFGNLSGVGFEPEVEIVTDTSYEELTCIGYEPALDRLEAVVHLKRDHGYLGNICSDGSLEYVRFWVDWDGSGSWKDEGLASFRAHDVPGDKPLEYAVATHLDPDREPCLEPQLPRVRAILSWNQPPPDDDPKFDPVWGNVLESQIQIAPTEGVTLEGYLDYLDVEIPSSIGPTVDPTQPLTMTSEEVSNVDLLKQYADVGVSGNRGGFSMLTAAAEDPASVVDPTGSELLATFEEAGFDLQEVVADIEETESNTRYEELECIGFHGDALTATIRVKRPYGYGGNLCTDGSQEFVAFWEQTSSGTWNHLGTTSVSVHDIGDIPKNGLEYAAYLPVDLSHRQQPCDEGPSVVKIRAISSWEVPPPPSDPTFQPTWGNREETHVFVPPGPEIDEGEHTPYMDRVGNMQVCDIDQSTGLASGRSTVAHFTANESPFGGEVYVSGLITNPPDTVGGGATPLEYRVQIRPLDASGTPTGPWQSVTNPFTVGVLEKLGPTKRPKQRKLTQTPDSDGWVEYLEDHSGSAWRRVDNRLLAKWDSGAQTGKWEIKLEAKMPDGTIVAADPINCGGGETRQSVVVQLDNNREEPTADIEITNGTPMSPPSGDTVVCKRFEVGDVVKGTYEGRDEYFSGLNLYVDPGIPSNPTISPSGFDYPSVTKGKNGTWTLDTTGMVPCGYSAEIRVTDRTIVNSHRVGRRNGDEDGFCLIDPEAFEEEDTDDSEE